jgi:hypothetical protein
VSGPKRTEPSWSLLKRERPYVNAASTDIRQTFARYTKPKPVEVKPMRRAK